MIINKKQPIESILIKCDKTNSTVMGYHEYQKKWDADIGEVLVARMKPTNEKDKYAVAVCKNGDFVGHLPKGKTGKLAKMIFYFLKLEMLCACKVKVAGKRTIFGDDKGLRIRCLLQFFGPKENIELLKKLLEECK